MFFKDLTKQIMAPLMLLSCSAWAAEGGISGGGGDVVVIPTAGDDRVLLADPWRKIEAPVNSTLCRERFALPPAVREELRRAQYLLSAHFAQPNFLERTVLDAKIHYCLVDELPARKACNNRMDYGNLPNGAHIEAAACTEGKYTWMVRRNFPSTLRDQALLYVHEGLRRVNASERLIVDVTAGLGVLLEKYNLQQMDEKPTLNIREKDEIAGLTRALILVGATTHDPRTLTDEDVDEALSKFTVADGGGLISRTAMVDPSAYIGAGVVIHPTSRVGANATIMASDVQTSFNIGENARIFRSVLLSGSDWVGHNPTIGRNVVIDNSKILVAYRGQPQSIWDKAVIRNSTLIKVKIEAGAEISDSIIMPHGDSRVAEIRIGETAHIEKSHILLKSDNDMLALYKQGFMGIDVSLMIGAGTSVRDIPELILHFEFPFKKQMPAMLVGIATVGISEITQEFSSRARFVISANSTLDGQDRPICPKGNEINYGKTYGKTKIDSIDDLRKLCSERK